MEFSNDEKQPPSPPPSPGSKEQSLRRAILMRDREAVKELLDEGADLNALDQLGWNALFYSAIVDDKKIAQMLVDEGGDATLRDPHQYLAYHYTFLTHGENQSVMVFSTAYKKQKDAE
jgi:ankyrin repeat protein